MKFILLKFIFQMLGVLDLSNVTFNRSFVLSTQSQITGGFSKYPDHIPGNYFYKLYRNKFALKQKTLEFLLHFN